MLNVLSAKLEGIFKRLRGQGVLSEANVAEALKEVRLALLEADVNFKIVKDFVERVRVKAVGQEVLQSLSPGHQVVKVVWDELVALMGPLQTGIALSSMPPTVIMMVGLQGVGKTTTSGKLARYFKGAGKRVLLVAADPRRPAAVEQLVILGQSLNIPVYRAENPSADAVSTCEHGVDQARAQGYDVVILDTGGRLHIDDDLMKELIAIKNRTSPHEILLVADAMIGQDAVAMAEQFNREIGVTGIILTKVEGDARGGAILSIKAVTGKPIKFLGTGEKLDALEPFHPDRMASRILGMGDVLSLIEKAEKVYDQKQAEILEKKLRKNQFTLEDFYEQMRMLKKMGSMTDLIAMLPGGKKLMQGADMTAAEKEFKHIEAIICSMTKEERRKPEILNGSRRRRIAVGSGTSVSEVNRFLKQYLEAKKMMRKFTQLGVGKMGRSLPSFLGNG